MVISYDYTTILEVYPVWDEHFDYPKILLNATFENILTIGFQGWVLLMDS